MAKQENSSNVTRVLRWNRREVQLHLDANRNKLTSFEIYCFRYSLFAIKETGEEVFINNKIVPSLRELEFCFDYEMTLEFTPPLNLEDRSLYRVIETFYKNQKCRDFICDARRLSKEELLYQHAEQEWKKEDLIIEAKKYQLIKESGELPLLMQHLELPPDPEEDYGYEGEEYDAEDYFDPFEEK